MKPQGDSYRSVPRHDFPAAASAPVAQLDRAPDYESGGREFESLRARQHLAPSYRAKNTAILRNLQGAELAPILRLMHSCIGQWLAPGHRDGGDRHRP